MKPFVLEIFYFPETRRSVGEVIHEHLCSGWRLSEMGVEAPELSIYAMLEKNGSILRISRSPNCN